MRRRYRLSLESLSEMEREGSAPSTPPLRSSVDGATRPRSSVAYVRSIASSSSIHSNIDSPFITTPPPIRCPNSRSGSRNSLGRFSVGSFDRLSAGSFGRASGDSFSGMSVGSVGRASGGSVGRFSGAGTPMAMPPVGLPTTFNAVQTEKQSPPSEKYCRKQLNFGKATRAYKSYRRRVPKWRRQKGNIKHPITPPEAPGTSSHDWATAIEDWRCALHYWNVVEHPQEAFEEGLPTLAQLGEEVEQPLTEYLAQTEKDLAEADAAIAMMPRSRASYVHSGVATTSGCGTPDFFESRDFDQFIRNAKRKELLIAAKNVEGYKNYRRSVPKAKRQLGNVCHPITPNPADTENEDLWASAVEEWLTAIEWWDCDPDPDYLADPSCPTIEELRGVRSRPSSSSFGDLYAIDEASGSPGKPKDGTVVIQRSKLCLDNTMVALPESIDGHSPQPKDPLLGPKDQLLKLANELVEGSRPHYQSAKEGCGSSIVDIQLRKSIAALVGQCSYIPEGWICLGILLNSEDRVVVEGAEYTNVDCFLEALRCEPKSASAWNHLAFAIGSDEIVKVGRKMFSKKECCAEAVRHEFLCTDAWIGLALQLSLTDGYTATGFFRQTRTECLYRGSYGYDGNRSPPTFDKSQFFVKYNFRTLFPRHQHKLMAAVHKLVTDFAESRGLSFERAEKFFDSLQRNAFQAGGVNEIVHSDQLKNVAVRLWKSTTSLEGYEFCFMLNEAIRKDTTRAINSAITIAHAINSFCVRRDSSPIVWPATNCTYRGGSLPRMHRWFFLPGLRFRVPALVATSSNQKVARTFMNRIPLPSAEQDPPWQEPVLWIFHFDASAEERCDHVNFIDRHDGTVTLEEEEFLFVPYSVFTVRSVKWEDEPVYDTYTNRPHRIMLDVFPDNREASEDLPLAPWS